METSKLIQQIKDMQKVIEMTRILSEGRSPMFLLDPDFAWTYFPIEMRKAVIDDILKDINLDEKENHQELKTIPHTQLDAPS